MRYGNLRPGPLDDIAGWRPGRDALMLIPSLVVIEKGHLTAQHTHGAIDYA